MTPQAIANTRRLLELNSRLYGKSPIIASNRGPVEYSIDNGGHLTPSRGGGGVAVALSSISRYMNCRWIAAAMSEGDRLIAEETNRETLAASLDDQTFLHSFVAMPDEVYHAHYNVFCNPFLWFFQHGMLDASFGEINDAGLWDSWFNGYIPANRAFADAVISEAADDESPIIMLHDYHLYLAAGYTRNKLPDALIQHFTHIPWPAADEWLRMPRTMSKKICCGLCSCDIVGMQTGRDVDNFLRTCQSILTDAEVDLESKIIYLYGHETSVRAYPISVDVDELRRLADSDEAEEYRKRLAP